MTTVNESSGSPQPQPGSPQAPQVSTSLLTLPTELLIEVGRSITSPTDLINLMRSCRYVYDVLLHVNLQQTDSRSLHHEISVYPRNYDGHIIHPGFSRSENTCCLVEAVVERDRPKLDRILSTGRRHIDPKSVIHTDALITAVEIQDLDVVELLLDVGLDPLTKGTNPEYCYGTSRSYPRSALNAAFCDSPPNDTDRVQQIIMALLARLPPSVISSMDVNMRLNWNNFDVSKPFDGANLLQRALAFDVPYSKVAQYLFNNGAPGNLALQNLIINLTDDDYIFYGITDIKNYFQVLVEEGGMVLDDETLRIGLNHWCDGVPELFQNSLYADAAVLLGGI